VFAGLDTAVTLSIAANAWAANMTCTADVGFVMQTGFTNGLALDNVSMHVMLPEPGTFALAGLGLLPLGYMFRRRRKNDAE
jgi:hypothetical protein